MHKACGNVYHGNPEIVRSILDKYPELVDCTTEGERDGYTPLMRASMITDSFNIVKMLLARGAMIDYQNKLEHTHTHSQVEGLTALMVAARFGTSSIVELLLEGGAAIDLKDSIGRTAIIIACEEAKLGPAKLLIENEADLNHVDCKGGYALLYAVKYLVRNKAKQFEYEGSLEIIELLLERGAKANIVTDDEETAEKCMLTHALTLLVSLMAQVLLHTEGGGSSARLGGGVNIDSV